MFFKSSKLFHLVVQVALLLLVCYFFYLQLSKITINSLQELRFVFPAYLFLSILLVFFNWFFEWLKWNKIVTIVQPNTSFSVRIKSFFSGILSGFLTPNLLGNFIGRMYYFPSDKRKRIILLTLLSNASQFFASMVFGVISVCLVTFPFSGLEKFEWEFKILLVCILLLLLVYYFVFERFTFRFLDRRKWFVRLRLVLSGSGNCRWYFFQMSLARHLIFSLQYVFVLKAFGIESSFVVLMLVWNVFFWSTLIPSLWFGKLLIRESVAIWVFTLHGYPGEVVLISSVLIWLVNQGLTALVSIPYFKFKAKDV